MKRLNLFGRSRLAGLPAWTVPCLVLAAIVGLRGAAALTGQTSPAAKATPVPPRAVIVTGIDYPGHKWRETTPVLVAMLSKKPGFQVEVREDPRFLASPELDRFDLVVLHFMNWEQPDPGPKARANLERFVSGGKGLVLVHFACGAFQDWPEFVKLAGRVWDPKLRGHDPRGPFRVKVTAEGREHPATRGLEDFDTDDELYTCLAGDRPIQILATAQSKVDGKDYPMAFVLRYGKGRVFHSPLGHDVKALQAPGVEELFRRGSRWATGATPPAPPPAPSGGS